jgi:hypothetical protein
MTSKFPLLPALTLLVLAIAAVEAAYLVRNPDSSTRTGARPAPQECLFKSSEPPDPAVVLNSSPLAEDGPLGPGEGLRPTIAESALAADSATDSSDPEPASASSAAPAEPSPEELAAQKQADFLLAREIMAEHNLLDFFNELELTDLQRLAAASAAEKIKAAELDQYQVYENFSKGMRQLGGFDFQHASPQKLQQFIDLYAPLVALESAQFVAYEALRPGLDPRQLHRLDVETKRFKQSSEGTKSFIEYLRNEIKERQAANKPSTSSKGP